MISGWLFMTTLVGMSKRLSQIGYHAVWENLRSPPGLGGLFGRLSLSL